VKVKLQADADLHHVIVLALLRREALIDSQSATAATLASLHDIDVLARAAEEGRALVTHDQRTMPEHFARFIASSNSPGLIVVPQHLPVAVVVDDLLLIWHATEADEWINRVAYLPI